MERPCGRERLQDYMERQKGPTPPFQPPCHPAEAADRRMKPPWMLWHQPQFSHGHTKDPKQDCRKPIQMNPRQPTEPWEIITWLLISAILFRDRLSCINRYIKEQHEDVKDPHYGRWFFFLFPSSAQPIIPFPHQPSSLTRNHIPDVANQAFTSLEKVLKSDCSQDQGHTWNQGS